MGFNLTDLSLRKIKFLRHPPPLARSQVSAPAEGVLQFTDLLRAELGPHPSLLDGLPFAVIAQLTL